MDQLDLAILVPVLVILLLGLVSRPREQTPLSRPLLALVAGIAVGPQVLNAVDVPEPLHFDVLGQASRFSLAAGLMALP